jgi:uncharacterized protein
MRTHPDLQRASTRHSIHQRLDVKAVGVGLKHQHFDDILANPSSVDFFEIHAENYMGAGGPPHHLLRRIRADYPISVHGVGLSIGGAGPLDRNHLRRLKQLIDTYQPALFSEHLAWSSHDGVFLNDLLPLPYNDISLAHVCAHVDEAQNFIGMRLLLENPSIYVVFNAKTMEETDFLRAVARRTGCGLLLDVNNVYVSAINHGFDATAYIDTFPVEFVGQVHLGGFADDCDSAGTRLLIDNHGRPVNEAVWQLYRRLLARQCFAPTLIEWDNNVPPFAVLADEAARARSALIGYSGCGVELAAA